MKFGFNRNKFLFIFVLLISTVSFCQQSVVENNFLTAYNNALQLFNNKAYAAAQKTFLKVHNSVDKSSNLKSDAAYYEAMCAIKLNQTDADKKVLAFVEKKVICYGFCISFSYYNCE
jgi:TolA-binding protein